LPQRRHDRYTRDLRPEFQARSSILEEIGAVVNSVWQPCRPHNIEYFYRYGRSECPTPRKERGNDDYCQSSTVGLGYTCDFSQFLFAAMGPSVAHVSAPSNNTVFEQTAEDGGSRARDLWE
jgi:hypothetical protein